MSSLRWIRKGRLIDSSGTALTDPVPTPNTINGLRGSDLILSNTNNILQIYLGGSLITIISVGEIICWDIQGRNIELITEDPTPLKLGFINNTEALIGLNVIETVANL